MSDISDGSSIAAHSARDGSAENSDKTTGLLHKLLGRRLKSNSGNSDGVSPREAQSRADARAMLVNVRNLHELRVEDVAVPKADIVAVSDDSSLEDLVEAFRMSTNSRLPVYNETLDNPLGMVHLKDVALNYGFSANGKSFNLAKIIRPIIYVPPSMPISALLQKMQSERNHMALVIDEYGGVDGLVTIEDLIEQIVGEIADEHDVEETALWNEEEPSVFLAQARAPLEEFEADAGVDLLPDDLDEDVDTLGGFVFMLCGRVPSRGEVIRDKQGNEFEVVDADARSIKKLRVRLKVENTTSQTAE